MISIKHSALLPHAADTVFDLVNDIEAYPEYMDGCVGAEVLQRDAQVVVARLDLSKAGVKHSFTTRNVLARPEQIQMELVEGPFSRFSGLWQFQILSEKACKVSLDLQFAVRNRVAARAAGRLFRIVGDNLVEAVCQRANNSV
ncbi:MAG: type II toxin-antitoxin system RatA family toxin [Pseudomonadales bacterium]